MSLSVNHLILHQIIQNQENRLEIHYRKAALLTDDAKVSKGFACFLAESEVKTALQAFSSEQLSFLDLSVQLVDKLVGELSKYPFAQEGTFILTQYQSLATDYLLIGFLTSKQSLKLTENLDLQETGYLDISTMNIVARVDLSSWRSDPSSHRYLSFVKGRVGRKIADFFLDFLQAEISMDTKVQNQVLLQAVEDFCTDARLDKEEKQTYRSNLYQYCQDQLKSGEDIAIKELAEELPETQEGANFYDYTQDQGYELEPVFPVDRSSLRKLKKFVGAGGGLSISFDSELLASRVFYDMETDTLTIKGTPPNLKDQLRRRLSVDD